MQFYIVQPGPDRPEYEHLAYRKAFKAYCEEKEAHLELDAIARTPVMADWHAIKAAQTKVSHAEDALMDAVESYVDAIRNTEYPVRRVQERVSA